MLFSLSFKKFAGIKFGTCLRLTNISLKGVRDYYLLLHCMGFIETVEPA